MDRIKQSSGGNEIVNGTTLSSAESTAPSVHKFVSPGILLFIDQLFVAVGNWIYWLMVSRSVGTSDVGHATTIYSLVLLVNTILQLGLEYPLLKKSVEHRTRVFGTVMIIEMAITALSVPIVFFATSYLYEELAEFSWIALGILVLSSVGFVSRFAMLGISQAKTILILDLVGTALKFGSAFALISIGYGATGILLSFLIHAVVLACTTTLAAKKLFGFGFGNSLFRKEIIKDGLVNMPSKLSGMLIISLSIILLASFGVDSSEVGTFYIAMMMSIIAGSFASSLAFMSIPASSEMKADLSTGSLRLGLAFTAPIITVLLLAPNTILGLVGTEYTAANSILPIMGAAVLPSVILSNASSKFNNMNDPKKLLVIGALRVGTFLAAFFVLVPMYGTIGAAYSILISFTSSAAISLLYSGKATVKYILITLLSIAVSVGVGQIIMGNEPQSVGLIVVLGSVGICLGIIFALRCVSSGEISLMAKALLNRGKHHEGASSSDSAAPCAFEDCTEQMKVNEVKSNLSNIPFPELGRGRDAIIVGNYGGGNLGDETMLDIIIELLLEKQSVKKIIVPSRRPDVIKRLHPNSAVQSTNILLGAFRALSSDILILGGGTIFSTFSGPGIRVVTAIAIIRKVLLRKKFFFYGIGYSSSTSKVLSIVARKAFNMADGVYVRDSRSLEILRKDLGIESAILMPELALFLRKNDTIPDDIAKIMTARKRPIIGLSLMYLPSIDYGRISDPVKEFIEHLHSKHDATFLFLTFQPRVIDYGGEWKSDQEISELIIRQLPEKVRMNCHALPVYSPAVTLGIISKLDSIISMRYHCLVFAHTQDKPYIAIAFEDKHRSFVKDYGGEIIELQELSVAKMIEKWEKLQSSSILLPEKMN